jgi:soluble lytic murein transglycosylase-like protein
MFVRFLTGVASLGLLLAATAAAPETAMADVKRAKYKARTNFTAARLVYRNNQRVSVARVMRGKKTVRRQRARRGGRVARSRAPGIRACKAAARRFGVPVSTALAVCRLESGFRCSAVGRAGELGLLQIKLATARALGYRGSRRGLLRCSTGAYWGMKHLALAIRRGGVWKHNQGLYSKRPSRAARLYARKVAALRRLYR